MGSRKTDPELARRIAEAAREVSREYREEQRIARRLGTWSYARRLRGFIEENVMRPEKHIVAMRKWYSGLPMHLTFTSKALGRWFREGEDVPCLMRGSLYALRVQTPQYAYAEHILKRWLRRKRLTCVSEAEWREMIRGNVFINRIVRLQRKWCAGSSTSLRTSLYSMVTGHRVLINGECIFVDEEKREALLKMGEIERALRRAA